MFRYEPFTPTGSWVVVNDDGTVSADPASQFDLDLALAEKPQRVCLPPVGPCVPFDATDVVAMFLLIVSTLGIGEITEGDEPELDNEVPDGAIA